MTDRRVIVYDLEIAESIDAHPDGWKAALRGDLGISSLALYDTATERYHVYMPSICVVDGVVRPAAVDDLRAGVEHLSNADVLVGWNSSGFDKRVIEGYLGVRLTVPEYDLLLEVQKRVGKQKGWKLGETSERATGANKPTSGVHAPELFKAGRIGELIDYNISDVHLTRNLANFVFDNGYLVGPAGAHVAIPQLERRI